MVLAIILAILIVIIGISALVIRLFNLESQFHIFMHKFLRFLRRAWSCILMFIRYVGVMIGSFFVILFKGIKKIFTKKNKKSVKQVDASTQKNSEDKQTTNATDDKDDNEKSVSHRLDNKKNSKKEKEKDKEREKEHRVVSQFSTIRPIMLPPKENEGEDLFEEKNTKDTLDTTVIDESEELLHNDYSAISEKNGNYREGVPDSEVSYFSPFNHNSSTEDTGYASVPNFNFYSSQEDREHDENKKALSETLREIRERMQQDLAKSRQEDEMKEDKPVDLLDRSELDRALEIDKDSLFSFDQDKKVSPAQIVTADEIDDKPVKKVPSIFDFSGKNTLKPKKKDVSDSKSSVNLDDIPESVKQEIIAEYLKNNKGDK